MSDSTPTETSPSGGAVLMGRFDVERHPWVLDRWTQWVEHRVRSAPNGQPVRIADGTGKVLTARGVSARRRPFRRMFLDLSSQMEEEVYVSCVAEQREPGGPPYQDSKLEIRADGLRSLDRSGAVWALAEELCSCLDLPQANLAVYSPDFRVGAGSRSGVTRTM